MCLSFCDVFEFRDVFALLVAHNSVHALSKLAALQQFVQQSWQR